MFALEVVLLNPSGPCVLCPNHRQLKAPPMKTFLSLSASGQTSQPSLTFRLLWRVTTVSPKIQVSLILSLDFSWRESNPFMAHRVLTSALSLYLSQPLLWKFCPLTACPNFQCGTVSLPQLSSPSQSRDTTANCIILV